MTTSIHGREEIPADTRDAVQFGLARKEDMEAAARIYVENFPRQVRQFTRQPAHAAAFYRDLMELMRICYGATFFAAWESGRLVGFLILTMPGKKTIGPALREGFLPRAAMRALTGKYGAAPGLFFRAGSALLGLGESSPGKRFADLPHVYVIAVAQEWTGRGIGKELQERAHQVCAGKFDAMWLLVERENAAAVRFYERMGFQIVESDDEKHAMMWEFLSAQKRDNCVAHVSRNSTQPRPEPLDSYWRAVRPALARLLAALDREPNSAAYGNFDRSFWAWRFRDCPVTMFQAAIVPLAQAWASSLPKNDLYRNRRVLEWIGGALDRACRIQNANGSFDVWGPHTDHPGIALAMALVGCRSLEILGDELEPARVAQVLSLVERACDFGLKHDEDYAFISNHQAHFVLAFHHAAKLLGKAVYQQRADKIIESILAAQSPDGWYSEYGGPDPGYESLGISSLASYWQSTRSTELLDSLRRSVEFYSYCVHPDGSVGGIYGSRHTQQYFPAGFEILSGEIPMAAAVARYIGHRLGRGNVVTPPVVDAENLAALAGNYLDACAARPDAFAGPLPPLPCEKMEDVRHFPASGITAAGTSCYYAVISAAKGGACRVFDKRSGALAYEDAGYLVRAGGKLWTSQRLQAGPPRSAGETNEAACTAPFTEVRPEASTPVRFLLFRLASLTLFRNVRLGAWLRRQIVARLITASRKGPLRLERRVRFGGDEIQFSDRIELERPMAVGAVEIARSFTAIHMGSSRYYHPAELEETPLPDVRGLAGELETRRSANCEFRLRFTAAVKPELLTGAAGNRAEEAHPEGTLTRP